MKPSTQIAGFNGVPRPIINYYLKHGLPGQVVSQREKCGKDNVIYISILFKDYPFRHKWHDDNKATRYSKIKSEEWMLDEIPLSE